MNRAFALIVVAATIVLLGVDLRFGEFFGPFIVLPIALLPFGLMGALLIVRVPGNIVGWLLGAAGLIFELVFASGAYGYVALSDEAAGLPGGWAAALVTFAGYAPAIACVVLVLFHFPSGRGLGGWWTWAERGLVAVIVIGTIANVFKDARPSTSRPRLRSGARRSAWSRIRSSCTDRSARWSGSPVTSSPSPR